VKRLEEELWFRDCDAGLPITRLGSVLRIPSILLTIDRRRAASGTTRGA